MPVPPDVSAAASVPVPVGTAVEILYACAPHTAGATGVVAGRGDEKRYLWENGYIGLDSLPQAEGYFTFATNPTDGQWVELDGWRWTFKDAPGTETHVAIGADLVTTLTTLANALNAWTDLPLSRCTYSLSQAQDALKIVHDDPYPEAEQFTLAASNASVSAPTLLFPDPNAYGDNITLRQKGADGLLALRQLKRNSAFRGDNPVWSADVAVPEAE